MLQIFAQIGRSLINFFREFGQIAILFTQIMRYVPRIHKDRRLVLAEMSIVGNESLPLVILIGAFTGAIAALQATNLFAKFNLIGIARPFIGGSISTVVFTELTPVLTALVIAGRVGGAIAAQLGTMQVSEQIDALEIAALTMMPVLAVFSNLVALIGAYVLTTLKFDFTFDIFFDSIQRFFQVSEILQSLFKSLIFGGVTALVGCHVGFATEGGAEGVGRSTVRAFTISAATILILDAVFGYIF